MSRVSRPFRPGYQPTEPSVSFYRYDRSSAMFAICSVVAALVLPTQQLAAVRTRSSSIILQHSKGWDGFGKGEFKFYDGFDKFMTPFPDEDRVQFPEMFRLPEQVYEVSLERPLGIAFEEVAPGKGVLVDYLVEGGNAEKSGVIKPGDVLIAVTAIKVFGARWERKLLPAKFMEFDQIMGAVGSNEPRWGAKDVILQFERPGADQQKVAEFQKFFEIPYDHVFRSQ